MSREPTLAHVPGIFLRAGMRLLARIVFAVAGIFLTITLALLWVAFTISTFRSARSAYGERVARTLGLVAEWYQYYSEQQNRQTGSH